MFMFIVTVPASAAFTVHVKEQQTFLISIFPEQRIYVTTRVRILLSIKDVSNVANTYKPSNSSAPPPNLLFI